MCLSPRRREGPAWSGRQRAPPPTGERRRCAPSPIPPEYRIQCGFGPVVVGDDVRRRQHRIDGHVRLRAVAALARHLTTRSTRGTSRRSGGFGYRGGRGGWALGVGGGRAGEVARSLPHHPKTEPTPDSRLWRCGTRSVRRSEARPAHQRTRRRLAATLQSTLSPRTAPTRMARPNSES